MGVTHQEAAMKATSAVGHVTTDTFDQEVLESDVPVVVDLYATWCGPCKMLGPVFEKMAAAYDGRLKFVKVDVEEEHDLATRFGVMGVPTILFFKDGALAEQVVGLPPLGSFQAKLDAFARPDEKSEAGPDRSGCGG
jgi:thioredoxin 1